MAYGLDEPDKLVFVGGQRAVSRGNWPAVVSNRVAVLQQHGAKAMSGGVALDHERPIKL
jgi:hypothetical protein